MSIEAIESVVDLIELGAVAPGDIVKCLRSAIEASGQTSCKYPMCHSEEYRASTSERDKQLGELDMLVAELDYENRLLRARNERLEKELAEQPAQQQEPVAYMNPDDLEKMKRFGRGSVAWATPTDFCTQPVYTSPPASKPWVGLVKEDWPLSPVCWTEDYKAGVAWAEAKLREKNA